MHNNPLVYTDPSGYSAWNKFRDALLNNRDIFRYLSKKPLVNSIVQTAICIATSAGCPAALAAYNAAQTYHVTGDVGLALQNGIKAGVSAAAFSAMPGGWSPKNIAIRGVIGGSISVISGGKFGHGSVSAGVGGGFGPETNFYIRVFVSGMVSEATGGKFANGASTAAFAMLMSSVAQSGHTEGDGPTPILADLSAEERAALDAEIARINESAGQNIAGTADEVASWLHEKAYGISIKYGVELGSGIRAYGDGYGFDTLTTDYSTNTVTIGATSSSVGYAGRWHSHPASANLFHPWDLNGPMRYGLNGYLSNQRGLYKFDWGAFNNDMGTSLGILATRVQIRAFKNQVKYNWGKPYVNKM